MKKTYVYYNEKEIKELLIGRKIKKVDESTLLLDNGTVLEIYGNDGCGGCSNGWYSITELNECDNIITNVIFNCDSTDDGDDAFQIFVYAEDKHIKLLQCEGHDNGYNGCGYYIDVNFKA